MQPRVGEKGLVLGQPLWLAHTCPAPHPVCLTPGALADAQGTGGRLTLTSLFRVDLRRGQASP
jgi:hypothetical protein